MGREPVGVGRGVQGAMMDKLATIMEHYKADPVRELRLDFERLR